MYKCIINTLNRNIETLEKTIELLSFSDL